jgi:hypothetical protein
MKMFSVNDQVRIVDTGEIGYVERLLDSGERVMVRIPASDGWPFPHHVYAVKEKVQRVAKGKSSSGEALF